MKLKFSKNAILSVVFAILLVVFALYLIKSLDKTGREGNVKNTVPAFGAGGAKASGQVGTTKSVSTPVKRQ